MNRQETTNRMTNRQANTMEIPPLLVPLLTSVVALARAKQLPCADVGALIKSFVGISESRTVTDAVRANDDRLLRRLVGMRRTQDRHDLFLALYVAAWNGRLALLKILSLYSPSNGSKSHDGVCTTAHGVVSPAPLDAMDWAVGLEDVQNLECVIAEAATYDQVEVAMWLFARFPSLRISLELGRDEDEPYYSYRENAVHSAARHGRLELLEMFHETGTTGWDRHVMEEAASAGHLEVVKWIFAHLPENCGGVQFSGAERQGDWEIIQVAQSNDVDGLGKCVADASASNNLDMLKWFREHYPTEFAHYALDGAVAHGNHAFIKYVQSCGVEIDDI